MPSYGWKPATLTHRAQDASIVAVTAQPVILADQLAENPSREVDSTQKAEISRTVTNTVSREAHWDVSSTVEQTVSYEIGGDAVGGKVGGSTSLSFTAGYGESSGTSESVEVGSAAGVEAVLKPGEAVVFELGITSGRIEAQVTYAVQLTGGVFVHYGKKKGGHYFWYLPLARLYDREHPGPAPAGEPQGRLLRPRPHHPARPQTGGVPGAGRLRPASAGAGKGREARVATQYICDICELNPGSGRGDTSPRRPVLPEPADPVHPPKPGRDHRSRSRLLVSSQSARTPGICTGTSSATSTAGPRRCASPWRGLTFLRVRNPWSPLSR